MDIKAMGEKVSEALALKGKSDSFDKQIAETKTQIKDNNLEIGRLSSLIPVRDAAVVRLKSLEEEAAKVRTELTERLDFLAKEQIILPLDNQIQNRIVRL